MPRLASPGLLADLWEHSQDMGALENWRRQCVGNLVDNAQKSCQIEGKIWIHSPNVCPRRPTKLTSAAGSAVKIRKIFVLSGLLHIQSLSTSSRFGQHKEKVQRQNSSHMRVWQTGQQYTQKKSTDRKKSTRKFKEGNRVKKGSPKSQKPNQQK